MFTNVFFNTKKIIRVLVFIFDEFYVVYIFEYEVKDVNRSKKYELKNNELL